MLNYERTGFPRDKCGGAAWVKPGRRLEENEREEVVTDGAVEKQQMQQAEAGSSGDSTGRNGRASGDAEGTAADADCAPFVDDSKYFEQLLKKYKVDVYINGHVHSYGRQGPSPPRTSTSTPAPANTTGTTPPLPATPVYLTVGGSGNDEMKNDDAVANDVFELGYYEDFKYFKYSVGYLELSKSKLAFELLDSVSREVVDSFSLVK